MLYKKIVLAGGNGYLGTVLANYYRNKAEQIIVLSRSPKATDRNIKTLVWDGQKEDDWIKEIDNADLLVNLCGKNVNCRYTAANRTAIFASRLLPTALLGNAIAKLENPPKLWINITSATIYRHAEDRPQDEETGEIGTGFSVNVCRQWEDTFFKADTPRTRKVALRMSFVLGATDSAFPRLFNMAKFGLGGSQGNGKQYVSWIHEHDAARCTEWLLQHPELNGIFNCTAPEPIKNKAFMAIIRKAAHIAFGFPTPAWLLGIGAVIIGTETELILKSRWVLPKRLTESGFVFQFPDTESAVTDILTVTKN